MAECSGGLDEVSQEISAKTEAMGMETDKQQPRAVEEPADELFEVERIVGTTKLNGQLLYKVRWRGYSSNWDTFEPVENLQTCLDLIEEFRKKKEELKEKRTVERKKRKAMMEGRMLPVQDKCASIPEIPIKTDPAGNPDTLKDTFWRDLEMGKVNLFETDMYSKVKGQGRASRPTSFKPKDCRRNKDSSDEEKEKMTSSKKASCSKRLASKRRQSKRNIKKGKGKIETAFDRAQLDCHNGINTPESLSSSSASNSRGSLFYTDSYSGQTVKSPVSIHSELLVKVERIQMGAEHSSPVTASLAQSDHPVSKDCSPKSHHNKQLSSNKEESAGCTDGFDPLQTCPSDGSQDDIVMPAAMKSIPKRSILDQPESGKKLRRSSGDISNSAGYGCTSASPEKGADQCYPQQAEKNVFSACVTSPEVSSEAKTATASASEYSITPPVTSPSYMDKADLPCIQSTISEGSDLETSCRGDKFSETSPPTDSGEEFAKNEEETPKYSVGILGTAVHLDDITPDKYDEQVADTPTCPDPSVISERQFQDAVSEGDYDKVKQALESGRQYNLGGIDATGMTLLMYAAQKGYDDIAEVLVRHGSRINSQQRNGTTALMLACEHSQLCSVVLMVELGANLNLQQTSGETALMKAVKRGSMPIVRFLLERGANFASQTIMGNSAMTYAQMLHVCDVEDILFEHVARLTAEFDRQVSVTINNTAKILSALFPLQCFPLCDGNKFVIHFKHELQPITPGVGYLLFIAHTRITPQEIKCRFYGPCAVTSVTLNGVAQPSLTEVGMKAEANFVLSCCPLNNGKNELIINTNLSPTSKAKLVVCAYKAKLME